MPFTEYSVFIALQLFKINVFELRKLLKTMSNRYFLNKIAKVDYNLEKVTRPYTLRKNFCFKILHNVMKNI